MIALPPLVVPDAPATLADVEAAVLSWGQQAMRQALAAAWDAQDRQVPTGGCPACGGDAVRPAGRKPRKVEARFGPAWLPRRRVRCADCGRHRQPADPFLVAELGGGRCTPGLRDLAALCGASWPYRQAAGVLGRVRGAPLAHETVRAVTAAVGAAVAEATHADARAACRTPARGRENARPVPRRVEVELDGGWVACTEAAHGLEVKVGVVHAGSEAVGRTRRRLLARRYAATARGVAAFEQLVTAAVEGVNGYAAPEQVLLGDGAGWIWRLGADCLPAATPVLDRWHLRDARRRALRAALPDKDERAPWSERVEDLLETGDVPGALAALGELAAVAPHEALDGFAGYLTALAPRIPDYAARRAAGERVGSGGVEKGVDLLVNRRLKGKRGMRWARGRVEAVVALRATLLNDEWDAHIGPALAPAKVPAN
jgi:hypothetical protein